MKNSMYIHSEELNQLKNELQAVFDNADMRSSIMEHVKNYEEKTLIPYLGYSSRKKYTCDFNIKKRTGYYHIYHKNDKEKYNIEFFLFNLDDENNIFISCVVYNKKINQAMSFKLDIQMDKYEKNLSELSKNDNKYFKIENVNFKISYDFNTYVMLTNKKLFLYTGDMKNCEKRKTFKKVIEYIALFQYLDKYQEIDANQILKNKNFSLLPEKLELHYLESDQKLDFKKSEENFKKVFGKVGDVIVTVEKNKPLMPEKNKKV